MAELYRVQLSINMPLDSSRFSIKWRVHLEESGISCHYWHSIRPIIDRFSGRLVQAASWNYYHSQLCLPFQAWIRGLASRRASSILLGVLLDIIWWHVSALHSFILVHLSGAWALIFNGRLRMHHRVRMTMV